MLSEKHQRGAEARLVKEMRQKKGAEARLVREMRKKKGKCRASRCK